MVMCSFQCSAAHIQHLAASWLDLAGALGILQVCILTSWLKTGFWVEERALKHVDVRLLEESDWDYLEEIEPSNRMDLDQSTSDFLAVSLKGTKVRHRSTGGCALTRGSHRNIADITSQFLKGVNRPPCLLLVDGFIHCVCHLCSRQSCT